MEGIKCDRHENRKIGFVCLDSDCSQKLFCSVCLRQQQHSSHSEKIVQLDEIIKNQNQNDSLRLLLFSSENNDLYSLRQFEKELLIFEQKVLNSLQLAKAQLLERIMVREATLASMISLQDTWIHQFKESFSDKDKFLNMLNQIEEIQNQTKLNNKVFANTPLLQGLGSSIIQQIDSIPTLWRDVRNFTKEEITKFQTSHQNSGNQGKRELQIVGNDTQDGRFFEGLSAGPTQLCFQLGNEKEHIFVLRIPYVQTSFQFSHSQSSLSVNQDIEKSFKGISDFSDLMSNNIKLFDMQNVQNPSFSMRLPKQSSSVSSPWITIQILVNNQRNSYGQCVSRISLYNVTDQVYLTRFEVQQEKVRDLRINFNTNSNNSGINQKVFEIHNALEVQ